MNVLNALIMNYLFVLVANAIISLFCFYYYHDKLYKYSLYLWLVIFFNLVLQGVFQQTPLAMVLAFSTYFFVFLIQLKILSQVTLVQFPWKKYSIVMVGCLLCSVGSSLTHGSFLTIALPVAVGIAVTTFHSMWKTILSFRTLANKFGTKIYCTLIIFHGLHQLDYPFLRPDPSFAVMGFSVALVLLIAFSIFLPSYILKDISDKYSGELSKLNVQLVDYQARMAEAISFATLGEMSYSFVHDMATPTSIVLLYASQLSEALKGGTDSREKIIEYTSTIEMATRRLFKMQTLMRSMASTKESTVIMSMDLRQVAKECVDLFEPLLVTKKINVDVVCGDSAIMIPAYAGCLETIVLNLVQNAINAAGSAKAVKDKRVVIRIERDSDSVLLNISDTGTGIPSERMRNLWERRGHSGDETTSAAKPSVAFQGTGFGLYNIKKMVDQLGGQINVKTGPEGTTFSVFLKQTLPLTSAKQIEMSNTPIVGTGGVPQPAA